MAERTFIPVQAGVLTVSDTRTYEDDRSGQLIVDLLQQAGHHIAARAIVKDNRDVIRGQLEAWIDDAGIDVVSSEYATLAAEQTALERLSAEVADQIVKRVAVYASRGGAPQ